MKLTRLRLFDFRNYETLDLTLDPGVNLILGETRRERRTFSKRSAIYRPAEASARRRRKS